MSDQTIEEQLSRFWLFQGFSQEELAQIAGFVKEKRFVVDETLFRQGDAPGFFYLVEAGAVEETSKDEKGAVSLHRRAEVGDVGGHRSLMASTPCHATAVVVRAARLLVIDADKFSTLLARFPRLQERLQRRHVVNRLLAIPLFSSFSLEQLLHVADMLRVVEYPAGQTIFPQGVPADDFYVIDSGQVKEEAVGSVPGAQPWPKYFTAGSFFGRYALLNKTTRRATATAVTDVKLFRFSTDAFHWLWKAHPAFKKALKRHDVLSCLRQSGAFSKLTDKELQHLAGYVGLAYLRPGSTLYRQGQLDPTLYFLYEGEAISRARDEQGKERPCGYLKTGDRVGESSLFLKEPRDVTVEATIGTTWFYLNREDLDQFLAQHPNIATKVVPREEVTVRRKLKRFEWMTPEEHVILERRRHWFFLLYRLAWPTLLLLVSLALFPLGSLWHVVGWGLVAWATVWMLWRFIDWTNDFYVVTTSRVVHREKELLVREKRDESPLDKIQNVNVDRGLVGNLFGFGNVIIGTAAVAGAARVTFTYLAEPEQVKERIFEQMARARAGERVEVQQTIREKLEASVGAGFHPEVPRPAVPSPTAASPAAAPRPSIGDRLGKIALLWPWWTEKRTDGQVIWRKHWIRLAARAWQPFLAVLVLLSLLVLYVTQVGTAQLWILLLLGVLFLPAAGWLWWAVVNWGNDQYILTDDRLIDIEKWPLGLRTLRTDTIFDKIQNVSFEIPDPLATLLNYGSVLIYTAGAEGRLTFHYVPKPGKVQAEIFHRLTIYEDRQRRAQREERWVDLPEWFAVYDETRRS
jgi:CRP-like cAMP-binding protein/membrane protein YdbS with pleckstrin-like domain